MIISHVNRKLNQIHKKTNYSLYYDIKVKSYILEKAFRIHLNYFKKSFFIIKIGANNFLMELSKSTFETDYNFYISIEIKFLFILTLL